MKEKEGSQLNVVVALANILSVWWRTVLAREGTIGKRELRSPARTWGLALMVVWAGFAESEALLYVVPGLCVLAQVIHSRKKTRAHSFHMGESRLTRWAPSERGARVAEGGVAIVLGMVITPMDKGVGGWLIASGFAHLLLTGFIYARQEAIDDDLHDMVIESRSRNERLRARR